MKRENPLVDVGTLAFAFGALAFVPSLLDRELLILSWLGGMQVPVGLSAMVVGAVLFGLGKLREVRNAAPAISPTEDSLSSTDNVAQPNVLSTPAPAEPSDRP
jgi:hypothetical protein